MPCQVLCCVKLSASCGCLLLVLVGWSRVGSIIQFSAAAVPSSHATASFHDSYGILSYWLAHDGHMHWDLFVARFDVAVFYKEAFRVLQQGGTLATWGYSRPVIVHNVEAEGLLNALYAKFGRYWDAKRKHIDEHYRGQNMQYGLDCHFHFIVK